jgi:hypothetical protein
MPIPSEAARRLDNDRPHTVALDPLKHGGEAGAHKDRNGIHMAGPGHCQKSCGYAGIEE